MSRRTVTPVGTTTLAYHLAHLFSRLGRSVLAVDLDPQASLTAHFLDDGELERLWGVAESDNQTIAGALRPFAEGRGDVVLVPPRQVAENLHPGPARPRRAHRRPPTRERGPAVGPSTHRHVRGRDARPSRRPRITNRLALTEPTTHLVPARCRTGRDDDAGQATAVAKTVASRAAAVARAARKWAMTGREVCRSVGRPHSSSQAGNSVSPLTLLQA